MRKNPYFIAILPKTEVPVVFSQGQFGTLQAPYNEFERLIRFTSELHYERTADQRRLHLAEQRIRELEELIARRVSSHELLKAALTTGFLPLADDGTRRVLDGTTSLEEIARVVDLTERVSKLRQ